MTVNLILVFLISLCSSVLVQFFLRRKTDYSGTEKKLAQKSRLLEQILNKQGEKWLQSIKDGVLEYNALYHQGHTQRQTLQTTLEDFQGKIKTIEKDRHFLTKMGAELKSVLTQTQKITSEMGTIEEAMQRVSEARAFMNEIEERMSQIEDNLIVQTDKTQNLIENLNRQLITDTNTAEKSQQNTLRLVENAQEEISTRLQKNKENMKTQMEMMMQNCLEIFQDELDQSKKTLQTFTETQHETTKTQQQQAWEASLQQLQEKLAAVHKENLQQINTENRRLELHLQNAATEISRLEDVKTDTLEYLTGTGSKLQVHKEQYAQLQNSLSSSLDEMKNTIEAKLAKEKQTQLEYAEQNEKWHKQIEGTKQTIEPLLTKMRAEQQTITESFRQHLSAVNSTHEQLMQQHTTTLAQEKEKFAGFLTAIIASSQSNIQKILDTNVKKKSDEILSQIIEAEIRDTIGMELQTQGDKQVDRVREVCEENDKKLTVLTQQRLAQLEQELERVHNECQTILASVNKSETQAEQLIGQWKSIQVQVSDEQNQWKQKLLKVASEAENEFTTQLQQRLHAEQHSLLKNTEGKIKKMETVWIGQLTDTVQQQHTHMQADVAQMERELHALKEKGKQSILLQKENLQQVTSETKQLKQTITDLHKELPVLKKANLMSDKLHATVTTLTEKLEVTQRENLKLDELTVHYEEVQTQRSELTKSIAILMREYKEFKKQEKLIRKLDGRFSRVDEAKEITEELQQQITQIHELKDNTDSYVAKLYKSKEKFESLSDDFQENEHKTREAIQAANHAKKTLDKFDYRQTEILKHIGQLEKRSNHLQKLENNILKVEARFEQMDTLLLDLEEKQKQTSVIGATFQDYKKKSDDVSQELSSLIGEAEEKMDKLVTFYEMIEATQESHNLEISQQTAAQNQSHSARRKTKK